MAYRSSSRLSYKRLRNLPELSEESRDHTALESSLPSILRRSFSSWLQPRIRVGGGVARRRWRRPRVRVAGLRRILRRKAIRAVRSAVANVVKRIKEGKPYIGELFAGNYMFMQVSPSPAKLIKSLNNTNDFNNAADGYRQFYGLPTARVMI